MTPNLNALGMPASQFMQASAAGCRPALAAFLSGNLWPARYLPLQSGYGNPANRQCAGLQEKDSRNRCRWLRYARSIRLAENAIDCAPGLLAIAPGQTSRRQSMRAASGWFGSTRARHRLRQVFVTLNIRALIQPELMISHAALAFNLQSQLLVDAISRQRMQELLENLAVWARKLQADS